MWKYALFLVLAPAIFAQTPAIYPRGIVNAASFMAPGLPAGGIARGSVFSIFGRRLGPATPAQVSSFPLATSLAGVSITVTQGSNSVDAIPLFVSAGQINALMPSNTPLGMVSVRVIINNARSNPSPVRVLNSSFGIFTATGSGIGPGILQNFVSPENQPINSTVTSAQPGQVLTLWGTGLGPALNADNVAPTPGDLPIPVEVFVADKPATKLYSGRSPCCSGVDQIVFTVPTDAPQGCWVPVYVRTANSTVSNVATIAIQSDGQSCTDTNNPASKTFTSGGKIGLFVALRAAMHEDIGVLKTIDVASEFFGIDVMEEKGGPFAFNPLLSLPPRGACTTYTSSGDLMAGNPLAGVATTGRYLEPGPPLSITGPKGQRVLTPLTPQVPVRLGFLGFNLPGFPFNNTTYLDPGDYSFTGAGGSETGPVSGSLSVAPNLSWTNRDQISTVNRSQGLTVNWTGATSDQTIAVVGGNVDLPTNSTALFFCTAPAGATSLTVPAAMLANVPPTRANILQSKSVVYVGALPLSSGGAFRATGLDAGLALSIFLSGKTVIFQ